ncbi:MAG: redoxin family protein [Ilumatobacteraceae bacterium]
MRTTHRLFLAPLVAGAFALSACGSDGSSSAASDTTAAMTDQTSGDAMSADSMADDSMTDDAMADEMHDDSMSDDAMTDDTMHDDAMSDDAMSDDAMSDDAMSDDAMSDGAMADLPAWQAMTLTDVEGNAFTLGDFMGKPVFVEHFATWCSNCRKQLTEANAAAAAAGDDAVFIALSVETELGASDVASYAADEGFSNLRFAVMSPEYLAEISDAFGNSAINPPSTPHFVIDLHGTAGDLITGIEKSDAVLEHLQHASM